MSRWPASGAAAALGAVLAACALMVPLDAHDDRGASGTDGGPAGGDGAADGGASDGASDGAVPDVDGGEDAASFAVGVSCEGRQNLAFCNDFSGPDLTTHSGAYPDWTRLADTATTFGRLDTDAGVGAPSGAFSVTGQLTAAPWAQLDVGVPAFAGGVRLDFDLWVDTFTAFASGNPKLSIAAVLVGGDGGTKTALYFNGDGHLGYVHYLGTSTTPSAERALTETLVAATWYHVTLWVGATDATLQVAGVGRRTDAIPGARAAASPVVLNVGVLYCDDGCNASTPAFHVDNVAVSTK